MADQMTLPPGVTPLTFAAFGNRWPEVTEDLLQQVAAAVGIPDPPPTASTAHLKQLADRYTTTLLTRILQLEADGVVQFVARGGDPGVFTAKLGLIEAGDRPLTDALVSYFDQTGTFNERTGETYAGHRFSQGELESTRVDLLQAEITQLQAEFDGLAAEMALRPVEVRALALVCNELNIETKAAVELWNKALAADPQIDVEQLVLQLLKHWASREESHGDPGVAALQGRIADLFHTDRVAAVERGMAEIAASYRFVNGHPDEEAANQRIMAFLAYELRRTPQAVLESYEAWAEEQPSDALRAAEGFLHALTPEYQIPRLADRWDTFAKRLKQAAGTDATLDEWLAKEYPDALDRLAREATISKRIVREILDRWAAAGVIQFARTKLGISLLVPGGWPPFESRSERVLRDTFARAFKILGFTNGVPDAPSVAHRHTSQQYQQALEVQAALVEGLAKAAASARSRGVTEVKGMTIYELFEADIRALKRADTFCWFDEPASAVEAASVSLPVDATLHRDLTPSHAGWWYFTHPRDIRTLPPETTSKEGPLPLHALLWEWTGDGLRVSCYVDAPVEGVGPLTPTLKFAWRDGETVGAALARITEEHGERYESGHPPDGVILTPRPQLLEAVEQVLRFFIAGCLWLQQTILVYAPGHIERHTRKRLERETFQRPLSDIQIIQLRRQASVSPATRNPAALPRDWRCRWVVKGFWRQQFYPSTGGHAPKWIDSFIKGPADKPLKVAKRVYSVSR